MDTYETLSEAISGAHIEACGHKGGLDKTYYFDVDGNYGFIKHERGTTIELADGLIELSTDYNQEFDDAYIEGMEVYRSWYADRVFEGMLWNIRPELQQEEVFAANCGKYYTPIVQDILANYDTSDGQGGDLDAGIVGSQCADKYIQLLAKDVIGERELDQDKVEDEIRERLTARGQTEEEIRLAMSQPIQEAIEEVATTKFEDNGLELF